MKQNKEIVLYAIILFLSIALAVYSTYLLMNGIHNLDLGQNLRWVNAQYGLDLIDINSKGQIWTGEEMYIYGQNETKKAFALFGISAFLIGFTSSKLIKKNDKR